MKKMQFTCICVEFGWDLIILLTSQTKKLSKSVNGRVGFWGCLMRRAKFNYKHIVNPTSQGS